MPTNSKTANDFEVTVAFASAPASDSPNIKAKDSLSALSGYFDAISVCFASLRRWNPGAGLSLTTDFAPPKQVQGFLKTLGVNVVYVPFTRRPPKGFTERFAASFYFFDAMGRFSTSGADAGRVVFVDPDVLCVNPLDEMLRFTKAQIGVYPMDFSDDEDINGISMRQAKSMANNLGLAVGGRNPYCHLGGEALVFPTSTISKVLHNCDRAVDWSFQQQPDQPRLTTEEHVLSAVLADEETADLSNFARRIWTARRHRTVIGDEESLALWHMPAEKNRGFSTLAKVVENQNSWFWSSARNEFLANCSRAMGINRTTRRLFDDTAVQVALRLKGTLGPRH